MRFDPVKRLMFFGGGEILLRMVMAARERVLPSLVVTSPRHAKEKIGGVESLVKHLEKEDFEFLITEKLETQSVVERITSETLAFSFGAAWIFKQPFIDLFNGKLVNAHGSRLPRDRGGGDFSWRIMRGDRRGVCLLHLVDAGVDTGPIVAAEHFLFPATCRLPADFQAYSKKRYFPFLLDFLDRAGGGAEFLAIVQDESAATYFPRLSTMDQAYIDWSWSARDIERFACAFDDPYLGACTYWNGREVRVKKIWACQEDGKFHPFMAGIIYRIHEEWVYVATRDGGLMIGSLTDGENQDVKDKLQVGDRLTTPKQKVDETLEKRIVYDYRGLKKV